MTRIGILGTGNMAVALATAWTAKGHNVLVGGRSADKAADAAAASGARAAPPKALVDTDVVVLAVAWEGVANALGLAAAADGAFAGKTLIDCSNPVDYSTGMLKVETRSAAEAIADLAPGAFVVKALHLFAGTSWLDEPDIERTVAICGDDPEALSLTADLVRDLGGGPAVVGALDAARQLEEAAGFVMRVVASGNNPRTAVPEVRV